MYRVNVNVRVMILVNNFHNISNISIGREMTIRASSIIHQVSIFDNQGYQVLHETPEFRSVMIELDDLCPGMYSARLVTSEGSKTISFVKA